jgi:signal transduction histidine kinase
LDDLGLLPALLWLFERYSRQTHVQVSFTHTGLEQRFASDVETAVYRIVQEALTNVARHAGVDWVSVGIQEEQATLHLRIEDRGVGFDPAINLAQGGTCGLVGMQERALLLGGQLAVGSKPDAGTCVTAELPLCNAQRSAADEPDRAAAG